MKSDILGAFMLGIASGVCFIAIANKVSGNSYIEIKRQAIERGHAEYVVDSDGKTTWQWKEEK